MQTALEGQAVIRFLGGPAAGMTFQLRRAPLFLRVVHTAAGELAALDMLGDQPAAEELISVYKREGPRTVVHIDFARGRKRNCSGWYVVATYRHLDAQPAEEVLRHTAAWQGWCLDQFRAAGPDSSKPSPEVL